MKKEEKKVLNPESVKNAIESEKDLTLSEVVRAYLSNHAKEHYLAAAKIAGEGISPEELDTILASCEKESGVYYVYTTPSLGDGKDKPTREDWEKVNTSAIFVEKIVKDLWYKKPVTIEDATTIDRIVKAYNRYTDAREGAEKRVESKLADVAAILGVSVEQLKAMRK